MEEPGGLQSMGLQRVGHDWVTSLHFTENIAFTIYFVCYSFNIESPSQPYGEGKGNPLQCSCLEIPRDRGTWWAAICGVAQSRTRLKRLSSSSSRHYWKVLRPCPQMFCLQFSHWAICQVFLSMLCFFFFNCSKNHTACWVTIYRWGVISCNKCPALVGVLIVGEAMV